MTPPAWLTAKLLSYIVGGLLLVALVLGGLSYCQKQRSRAAQARVDSAQAGAASNSAADAINTVSAAGGRESASEGLTRTNSEEIRNAQGADARVGAGVNAAGLRSLCRRAAYRDSPKCKLFRAAPK